jgi:hypothetical protein
LYAALSHVHSRHVFPSAASSALRNAGMAVASVQWGAWAGNGMAVTHNLLPRIIKSGETPADAPE